MIKEHSTYRKKLYYLLGSIPFIITLLYFFSFKKSYEEYKKYHILTSYSDNEDVKNKIVLLRTKIQTNELELNNTESKTLLDIITIYSSKLNLKITDFAPPKETISDQYNIITQKITLNGSFEHILSTLHQLEEKERLNLSSIQFKSYYDSKKNEEYLLTTLYIQKIIPYENN